jgi:signal transduction histidine kinase
VVHTLQGLTSTLFDAQGYIPHGHCYLWKPGLVWLHVLSNTAIALSYFSIPATLMYFIARRKDVPFQWVFVLFGAFIIACGMGHVMDIWTVWHPTYWLSGTVKALTAVVSVYTAIELIPLVPKALALPSPAQLEAANRELEQALADLRQTQAQLIQTEKMSSLGQLVAGVAHEINNPVNFIYGNLTHVSDYITDLLSLLQHYQTEHPTPSPMLDGAIAQTDLEFIQHDLPKTLSSMRLGADRIRQIVLSLRNFSRIDEATMKPTDLHECLDSTLLMLQHRLKARSHHAGIQLERQYGEIPRVPCYPGQISQVFMNILSNALDALEHQAATQDSSVRQGIGTITIETKQPQPDQVQIVIADDGPGISPEAQAHVFDVFFTTKPMGKGTGLGLAISHQIVVEKHGGTLECHSEVGKGTQFLITLNLEPEPSALSAHPPAAPTSSGVGAVEEKALGAASPASQG